MGRAGRLTAARRDRCRRALGDPDGADASWHLHGLGTLPQARGQGIGGLLTAAATREGFDAGVDWVSLGMYASNETARRVYLRLGFAVEGRFTSYRSLGATAHGQH